ncbi:glycosyltransferase [Microbacterium album]|uniref:Glycosyl transferase n=1 Tax=Microbacterium album TaxID=2053191 RepID=A0A917IFI8_9MICO|nr:glycosyltransferase [Microbacterium album]GGH41170.1 glycosyl transferase [Microbacterium album]
MFHNDYIVAGGEYHSVREEFDGLQRAGVEARLLLSDNEGLQSASARKQAVKLLTGREEYERCKAEIARFRPDVLHLQNLFPSLSVGVLRAAAESGVPWVRSLRNYRLRCLAATLRYDGEDCRVCHSAATGIPGIARGCYRGSRAASAGALAVNVRDASLSRRSAKRAYIVLSHAMKKPLKAQLVGERVFVKPNIVTIPEPEAAPTPLRYDAVFVGRAVAEKGIETVLETARRAPELRFAAVGTERGDWNGAAGWPENVESLGVLPQPAAVEVMATSRTLLVPSVWAEPFGRVAAEALSVGAIPLVADRGGLPEIAQLLAADLVLPHDVVHPWVSAVRHFASMAPQELTAWRTAARRVASENFAWRPLTDRLINIYREVSGVD